jgi:hypothetical protein
MSATAALTRRLVEHRYGHPVEHLHRQVAHHRSTDPVLPIVLRRLHGLEQTGARIRIARHALRAVVQTALDDDVVESRLRACLSEVAGLEQRELSQAEAVWDLLDVRLLLDRPGIRLALGSAPTREVPGEVMRVAREVAASMPRLTRDGLREGLRARGIRISSHRVGLLLRQLRTEHSR